MDNKQDQFSDFTLNHYPRDPGDNKPRFLGTMRVPVRDAAGQVTETHFFNVSGWGPNQALNGKDSEYVDIRLQPVHANPVDDARYQQRKSAFDPGKAENQPASFTLAKIDTGRLFVSKDVDIEDALTRGKELPALRGFAVVMIGDKPRYVEAALWTRVTKSPRQPNFLGGNAEIHDPVAVAAALATKQASPEANPPRPGRRSRADKGDEPQPQG